MTHHKSAEMGDRRPYCCPPYTWKDGLLDPGELWRQTQVELHQRSSILNATGGVLKLEKCTLYLLDYTCEDGEWSYAEMIPHELFITNPDRTKSYFDQEGVAMSKKTLGIHDSLAGGSKWHLKYIQQRASMWTSRMTNGHLPHRMAWIAYKLQLWPGLSYGLGTMTNDIEEAASVNTEIDYKMLNILEVVLGVACTVTKDLWALHTTFGEFGYSASQQSSWCVESTWCYNIIIFHKSQQETQCIPEVLATATRHTAQPHHIGLQQIGTPSPPFLGQDAVEVAP